MWQVLLSSLRVGYRGGGVNILGFVNWLFSFFIKFGYILSWNCLCTMHLLTLAYVVGVFCYTFTYLTSSSLIVLGQSLTEVFFLHLTHRKFLWQIFGNVCSALFLYWNVVLRKSLECMKYYILNMPLLLSLLLRCICNWKRFVDNSSLYIADIGHLMPRQ